MEPPNDSLLEPGASEPRPAELHFPLMRDDYALSDLLSRASEAWSRDLGAWVLAMVLYAVVGVGIPMALALVSGIFEGLGSEGSTGLSGLGIVVDVIAQIVQLVLGGIFTLGFWAMALRGLHGERATVGALFSQISKIWKYVLQWLALALATMLFVVPIVVIIFLAFVGPVDRSTPMTEIVESAGTPFLITFAVLAPLYVYALLGIVFMQAELAFNDDAGPLESIVYSWRIARGKRWSVFGVALIAGLIVMGSLMLCGIGVLFGAPFATLLVAALYLTLRQGADVPPADSTTALGGSGAS